MRNAFSPRKGGASSLDRDSGLFGDLFILDGGKSQRMRQRFDHHFQEMANRNELLRAETIEQR